MYYLASTQSRPVANDWRADVTRNGMLPPDDYVIERDLRQLERIEYQRSQENDFVLF
jgi:hypothetical protein